MAKSQKRNPFMPDMPVPPSLFGGRAAEVRQIEHALDSAVAGSAQHLLVQGERWIGKTSTAQYAESIALMWPDLADAHKITFYSSFCSLGSCSSLEEVCVTILDSFMRMENSTKNRIFELLSGISGVHVGPVGITLDRSGGADSFRPSEFARILEESLRKATDSYQAFLLILDETEQAAAIPRLGSLLKDTLEHLNRVGIRNFTTLMTATREGVDALTNDHPSFPRLFRYVNLATMSEDECKEVVQRALKAGVPQLELTAIAAERLFKYSGGFPGLVQELGKSAFEVNRDDRLDENDLVRGIVGSARHKGARDTIFDKHFGQTLAIDLKSERYGAVLEAAVDVSDSDNEFSYKDMVARLAPDMQSSVSPYVGNLVKRGMLERTVHRDRYRFPKSMLPLWIRLNGVERAKSR